MLRLIIISALEQEGNDTPTLYHYRQAVSKQPDYVEAWFSIGKMI